MSQPQDIPDDAALAAEYVLRLLDAESERAFEARLSRDPALRDEVRFWEQAFADLAQQVPAVPPSPAVKDRLLDDIGQSGTDARKVHFWRWLAIPSLAVAVIAAFLVLAPVLRDPGFDPAFHATLMSSDGALHIEAGYAPDGNLFKVIPERGAPEPGRDFELWVIGEGADAPVSLGVIPTDRESLFEISPGIAALIDGGTLAVSDEPQGGSPTGAPTGNILATDDFFDI